MEGLLWKWTNYWSGEFWFICLVKPYLYSKIGYNHMKLYVWPQTYVIFICVKDFFLYVNYLRSKKILSYVLVIIVVTHSL